MPPYTGQVGRPQGEEQDLAWLIRHILAVTKSNSTKQFVSGSDNVVTVARPQCCHLRMSC